MIKDFDYLKKMATNKGVKTIAIAVPEDENTINALLDLTKSIEVKYILVGDEKKITKLCNKIGLQAPQDVIIHTTDHDIAAQKAVELIKNNTADILMKGSLATGTLLKAVLNKETGIGTGSLMSHLAVIECPTYHKLMYITDGGINPAPDLDKKRAILSNSVDFMLKLGYTEPKVAALCAAENVSEKIIETVDANQLQQENINGIIKNCIVEGPIAFDLAISEDSAKAKNYNSKIAGHTDLFLAPNISTGNVLAKSLLYLANSKMAGCVLGAKAPIVLTSRGATAEEKLLSFLLTLAAA